MPAKKVAPAPVTEESVIEAPKKKRTYTRKPKTEPVPIFVTPAIEAPNSMVGKPLQISVVIPAYNEAERIAPTLVEAHAFFSGRNDAYEIVVVDDGSTDRTAEIVERMALDMPQLRLVRMDKNSGKGAAVARGMVASKGAVRLFADADGSTPFDEFPKLGAAIAAGASVAFGSRALPDSVLHPPQPKLRTVLGRGSNLIIQMTNLPGVKDSQCGFKAFTAEAAEAIFPHLKMHRWGFDIEILVMARRLGLKSTEVAVYWRDRAGSKLGLLKPKAYLQTLWEDLRIRYNALTGAYPKKR